MGSYSVHISVDKSWVDNFNKNGLRLCMAKATKDASGNDIFNVVALTLEDIATNLDVTWTDQYAIEASTIVFNQGAKIVGTADRKDITFQQKYQLLSWGSDPKVFQDSLNVNVDQIGFSSKKKCSAILYLKQGNAMIPVYISPGIMPPGDLLLTPLPKVVFWWQHNVVASTMISTFVGESIQVGVSTATTMNIKFNKEGLWEVL